MLSLSSYFSAEYLAVILPGTLLLYWVFPQKIRRVLLLLVNYLVFWMISGKLLVFLLFATFTMHYVGLWLAHAQKKFEHQAEQVDKHTAKEIRKKSIHAQRWIVAFGVSLLIGLLFLMKYGRFFAINLNLLFLYIKLPIQLNLPAVALPIGISFYTMEAASYLFDVYRKKISTDDNLFRLALYISFFPQLMEGPICRYTETASQLWAAPPLQWNNVIAGAQRILWGMMKKMVVADRLNILIQTIFDNYESYNGFIIAVGAVCYTIQLYMDFSGTLDLVIGSGELFGITLTENFRQPFFSRTVSEFWKRWHITLGAWFRDYIFYPLSFSGPLKRLTSYGRKKWGRLYGVLPASAIALFCVWICNGLWHGAAWSFLFFGMYHFALILGGKMIEPPTIWLSNRLHMKCDSAAYKCFQMLRTTVLVCIGELIFRANGLRAGLEMLKILFNSFSFSGALDSNLFSLGADWKDFIIVGITLLIVLAVSILHESGISIRKWAAKQNLIVRYGLVYLLILYIVIFGAYGAGYVPVDPIYAGF